MALGSQLTSLNYRKSMRVIGKVTVCFTSLGITAWQASKTNWQGMTCHLMRFKRCMIVY
jgi:hypothetical protein